MFLSYGPDRGSKGSRGSMGSIRPIRPIRLIRGKKSSGVLPSRQLLWYAIYTEGVAPGYSW